MKITPVSPYHNWIKDDMLKIYIFTSLAMFYALIIYFQVDKNTSLMICKYIIADNIKYDGKNPSYNSFSFTTNST